jgi:hypothetical protein
MERNTSFQTVTRMSYTRKILVVSDLIVHQGGADHKARRVSGTVAEPKVIAVAPQILATYTGSPELRPGMNTVVTLEGGQLMMQCAGQPNLPLFAASETNFSSRPWTPKLNSSRMTRARSPRSCSIKDRSTLGAGTSECRFPTSNKILMSSRHSSS